MPAFTDQLNRTILVNAPPRRIVSLVPSQTELLYQLGLEENVAGITKFCIYPRHWSQQKKRVGGTKSVNMDAIRALQPDLIIANKEENNKDQIAELEKHYPVWISDVHNLAEALVMIRELGEVTGKPGAASDLCRAIQEQFNGLATSVPVISPYSGNREAVSTVYLIWRNPYMAAGGDTFINNMMQHCGFTNALAETHRYPTLTSEQLIALNPGLVLLSSEPFPFSQKHVHELRGQLPHAQILLVNGEFFSWYGSRLLQAAAYFKELISQVS